MSCSLLSYEEGGEWTCEASSYSTLCTQWTYTVVRGSVMGQDFRLQLSSPNRHELWQMQVESKQASFVVWKRWEFGYHRLQSSSYTPLSAICVSPSVQGTVHSVWGREQTGEWCTHQLTFCLGDQLLTWWTAYESTSGYISGTNTREKDEWGSCNASQMESWRALRNKRAKNTTHTRCCSHKWISPQHDIFVHSQCSLRQRFQTQHWWKMDWLIKVSIT